MQLIPDAFLAASRLWLLLGVAALGVLYLVLQWRRRSYAVRFTNIELLDKVAPRRPGWRRHVPAVIFLLAMAALVVGFARPSQQTQIPREQATIVLAIDTSLSMEATDVSPTRFEAAKEAAIAFAESLPDEINLGLIGFNGVATIRVQPTTNHEAVAASIATMEVGPATAIGEAIFASLDAVATVGADALDGEVPPARIVVMSDGETTVGRSDDEAVAAAQQVGISVSTIAFGTDAGVIVIPEEDRPVPVPVNEEKLAAIADATGGEFFTAASADELEAVYTDIGSRVALETVDDEITPSYVGLALLLLAVAGTLSLAWFSRLP